MSGMQSQHYLQEKPKSSRLVSIKSSMAMLEKTRARSICSSSLKFEFSNLFLKVKGKCSSILKVKRGGRDREG